MFPTLFRPVERFGQAFAALAKPAGGFAPKLKCTPFQLVITHMSERPLRFHFLQRKRWHFVLDREYSGTSLAQDLGGLRMQQTYARSPSFSTKRHKPNKNHSNRRGSGRSFHRLSRGVAQFSLIRSIARPSPHPAPGRPTAGQQHRQADDRHASRAFRCN